MAGKKPPKKKNQTPSHHKNAQLSDTDRRAMLVRETRRLIENTQRKFTQDTLRCETRVVAELAEMLVDMAEDLHSEIGLWSAYEQYNLDLFGTELPLTSRDTGVPSRALHPDRFCHFLWVMYPVLIDGLILSPNHSDLRLMAVECSEFLSVAFSKIPKTSTRREFLQSPNDRGWDVKKKLIWLGTSSYLFRRMFTDYMAAEGVPVTDIPSTDDLDGIGVFLNPAEGKEIMTHFTSLVSALKHTVGDFSEDQEYAIRGFLMSSTISPAFVKRVLTEYGDQVVRQVFILKGEVPPYWLDYFMRRYKGKYFRRRYPELAVI